jgi:hypothetical protein
MNKILMFAEWIDINCVRNGEHIWKYKGDNFSINHTTEEMLHIFETENKIQQIRPSLIWFIEKMENKLKLNDHKGGWKNCDNGYLLGLLNQEIVELEEALQKDYNIIDEAIDVANFAMMIADNNN